VNSGTSITNGGQVPENTEASYDIGVGPAVFGSNGLAPELPVSLKNP
jgi:hypothetical protein